MIQSHLSGIPDGLNLFRDRMHAHFHLLFNTPNTMPYSRRDIIQRRIETREVVPPFAPFSIAASAIVAKKIGKV